MLGVINIFAAAAFGGLAAYALATGSPILGAWDIFSMILNIFGALIAVIRRAEAVKHGD